MHGFVAADFAFVLLLAFAVLVGGRDALVSVPRLLLAMLPENLMAAEASVEGPTADLVLPVHWTAPKSPFAPRVLYPIEPQPIPDWLSARRLQPGFGNRRADAPNVGNVAAIVIDDLGNEVEAARQAIALPPQIALAFLPYADNAPWLSHAAARAGHEVLAHVPMEPLSGDDPGPMALRTGLSRSELVRRLDWALTRLPDAVGINNHMGSRFTLERAPLTPIVERLADKNLFFFDSRTTAASQVVEVAHAFGVASAERDVFLDDVSSQAAIAAQLDDLAERAARDGVAIAIGHPHLLTLDLVDRWARAAAQRGLHLVTLRQAMRLKTERAMERRMASSE